MTNSSNKILAIIPRVSDRVCPLIDNENQILAISLNPPHCKIGEKIALTKSSAVLSCWVSVVVSGIVSHEWALPTESCVHSRLPKRERKDVKVKRYNCVLVGKRRG